MSRRRRILAWAGSATLAFVAFVGFAHTSAGRTFLSWLPGVGCPLDRAPLTAERRDQTRTAILAAYEGEDPASTRTVLGLELERARFDDVVAWAADAGVACAPASDASSLQCPAVPLGDATGVGRFSFDGGGRLVAFDVSRRDADAGRAAAFVRERAQTLRADHGEPTSHRGEASEAFLRRGALGQVAYEYRFSDMRTTLSATNLGHGRYLVRETWQAVGRAG